MLTAVTRALEHAQLNMRAPLEHARAHIKTLTLLHTHKGLILVVLLAFAWVGAQQFAKTAVTIQNFNAPYFTVWFSTLWMSLCYPGYCVFAYFTNTRVELGQLLR